MKVTLNLSLILQSNNEECKDYCMRCIAPLLSMLLLFLQPVIAQDFSNKGREFWIPYPGHIDALTSRMALYISSDVAASGEVRLGTNGPVIPFTVVANQATTVQITPATNSIYNAQSDGINAGKGIQVVSDNPIVVYSHVLNAARSGSTLVLPTNVLGRDYYAMAYTQVNNAQQTARSQITVVGVEDQTVVELTLKQGSIGSPGRPANQPYTITLNKGDVYQVQSFSDLTGSRVRSLATTNNPCKPIAVFSGSTWASFNCTNASGGDNLFQQLFPSVAWGRNYVTAPFAGRNADLFRIMVRDVDTEVRVDGNLIPKTLLRANSYYEVSSSAPLVITSNAPVSVAQYMTSQTCDPRNPANCGNGNQPACPFPADPEIIILNPIEQTINNVTVVAARRDLTPPNTNIIVHYINVIMKTASISSLRINGAVPQGNWNQIIGTDYSYIQENITNSTSTNPIHNIRADDGFVAFAYGMGQVESYGYNAGTNVLNLERPISVLNPFTTGSATNTITCVNNIFKLNLTLSYIPKKLEIDWTGIAGINPSTNYIDNAPSPADSFIQNNRKFYLFRIPVDYVFTQAGNARVKILTSTNTPTDDGCSTTNEQEIIDNITVVQKPISNFGIETNGCINSAVILTDSSNGNGRAINSWIWDFGNGQSASSRNTQTQFNSAGTYNIKLRAINDVGCFTDTTKSIVVSSKPVASFTIPDTTCVGNEFTFIDGSSIASGTIERWTWRLDSITTITNTNNSSVKNRYTATGTIPIQLVLQSTTGCVSDTLTKNLFVRPLPQVGLVLPGFCLADAEAIFTDTSRIEDGTESEFKYRWNFNLNNLSPAPNILTSTDRAPRVRYTNVGIYRTSLELTSKFGCVAKDEGDFVVNGSRPKASFVVLAKDTLCTNADMVIRNTSEVDFGGVTRVDIVWDRINNIAQRLSDLSPSDNKLYNHRYPPQSILTQNYTVRLVAYSGNAAVCQDSIEQVVTIKKAPQLVYEVNPGICFDATPRAITQAREIGSVPGSFVFSGNGVNAAGIINPVTAGVGTHIIQYKYIANSFCVDSVTQPITVWPSPTAKFAVLETIRCEQNALSFSDSSVANFSNLVQWNWNFGDATTQSRNSAATFLKTFATSGTYPVSLRVTSDSGCVSPPVVQNIRIDLLPRVNFNLPGDVCLPDGRASFSSTSTIPDNSDALFQYRWNFGDPNNPNAVSTLPNPTHRYTAVGPVNVKLKVTSKDGCIDSLTQIFNTIYPQPKAIFAINKSEVCIDTEDLSFTDQGQSSFLPARNWFWNFGDGGNSMLNNPLYRFRDSGTFTVRYHFIDGKGCISDTASQIVTVHPYPKLDLGPDMVVLEGGEKPIIPAYVFGTDLSYKWVPATYLSSDTARRPITKPLDDITYELFLTGIGGCTVSDDVFVKLLKAPEVPNAFSPNGDGIHDVWLIKYLESYPGATVDVFNRYGQTVYSSVGYPRPWDGTSNGKAIPVGTYYYVIDPKNGRKIITGSVTILR